MEIILSWLNGLLFPGTAIRIWMAVAVGVVLILSLIFLLILVKRKKKGKMCDKTEESTTEESTTDESNAEEPITEQPKPLPVLELANLQGIGAREEQQDAFGLSHMEQYEENGLLAVLCDGMGGMAEGGMIARQTVSELVGIFPWAEGNDIPGWISQHSGMIYKQFLGHGGTTLVAVLLKANRLFFWCVGDSDLFLLREEKLYELNIRQEYKNDLVLRALSESFSVEDAFYDPQAGALSEYIGKDEVVCDFNYKPFLLQPDDVLLLSSDGVSDTLTLKQIREAMALPVQDCCDKLEAEITEAAKPNQDNYTAIVLKYHGSREDK